MCFAPQRRALFQHLNFQKWSDAEVLCTFWLRNVLRATTACTFSTSQLPKLLGTPQFLIHFTSKCASRHNAVHFFNISTSKSGPTLRCFVPFHFEIGFALQRRATFHLSSPHMSPHPPLQRAYFSTLRSHKTTKKTQCFATFLPFRAPASSFFWSFLFRLVSLLTAFSSLHIVGSLTSKLPSMKSITKADACKNPFAVLSTRRRRFRSKSAWVAGSSKPIAMDVRGIPHGKSPCQFHESE